MFERDNSHIQNLLDRFRSIKLEGGSFYFDIDDYESLIDHFIDHGEDAQAEYLNNMAIEQHPQASTFYIKRAQLFGLKGMLEDAHLALDLAEGIDPLNHDLLLNRGNLFSREGKHDEAIQLFKTAYHGSDEKSEIALLIAYEYQNLAEYETAAKWLKHCLKLDPQDDVALYNLAFCLEMCSAYSEGIEYFNSFIEDHPFNEVAWHQLGLFYHKKKDPKKALWALDYAMVIDETFSAAYHEKARILNELGRPLQAAKCLAETLAFEEPSGYVFLKISESYKEAGFYKEALIHSIKATHYDPQLDEAWMERALILETIGRPHEAVSHLKKALELDPDNPDYWYITAQFYKRNKYLDEAERSFQQLIELGCVEMEIWIEYTDLLLDLHQTDQAIEALYSGIDHNPDSAELHYLAAGILFSMDEEVHAFDCLRAALKLNFEKHSTLLDNFPDLKERSEVKDIIRLHVASKKIE